MDPLLHISTAGPANDLLREASGTVASSDPLVSFLYELLRDHLPAGTVQRLVNNVIGGETVYSNGWLARYAEYLAETIRNANVEESDDQAMD